MRQLTRIADSLRPTIGGVSFAMADGGRRIECFVTTEALLARAGVGSLSAYGMAACFRKYETEVEEAVLFRYERRQFDRLARIVVDKITALGAPVNGRDTIDDAVLAADIAAVLAAEMEVGASPKVANSSDGQDLAATPSPAPPASANPQLTPAALAAASPAVAAVAPARVMRAPAIDNAELARPAAE